MRREPPAGFEPLQIPSVFVNRASEFFVRDRDGPRPTVGAWISEQQSNSEGVAHGGFLLTFADVALTMMIKGITLSLSADFIRPAPMGGWIEAQVLTRRRSDNLIFADAMTLCEGRPILRVSGLFKPFVKRPAAAADT